MIVNHHDGDISIFSSEKGTSVSFTISRSLQSEHPGELTFCDNPVEYITNSYSPMYIYLSDVCEWMCKSNLLFINAKRAVHWNRSFFIILILLK